MGDSLQTGKPPRFVTSHSGQLSLLPSVGRKMSTGESAVTLGGWGVKAGMVIPLVTAPMEVKFGMEEGTFGPLHKVPSSMPNFTSIGATCRPCGRHVAPIKAKNLKIGL